MRGGKAYIVIVESREDFQWINWLLFLEGLCIYFIAYSALDVISHIHMYLVFYLAKAQSWDWALVVRLSKVLYLATYHG